MSIVTKDHLCADQAESKILLFQLDDFIKEKGRVPNRSDDDSTRWSISSDVGGGGSDILYRMGEGLAADRAARYAEERRLKQELEEKLNRERSVEFNTMLVHLIQEKRLSEVDVYTRANLSRQLFSKIRTGNGYLPKKKTILALCIAMELSLPETENLLKVAGYALSPANKTDIIVEFYISKGIFDFYQIDEALAKYKEKPFDEDNLC